MASSVTIANINGLLGEIGPMAIDDAITRFSTLWDLIPKKDASDSAGPTWRVKVGANSSAEATVPGGSLPAADAAEFVQARLNWGNYPVSFTVSHQGMRQIEKARELGQELANMVEEQLAESVSSLASAVATDLIAGSDTTKAIVGLCTAIDDTGTYAGIAQGSYSEWGCYVAANSGSGRTLTVSIMDIAYDYFVNTVKAEPGAWVILTGTAQASTMRGFSTGAVSPVPSVLVDSSFRGVPKVLSHASIMFRDLPVLTIPGYTTGRIDFVNLNALSIECLNGAATPFYFDEGQKDATSDLTVFKGYFNGQLVLRNRRHNAFSIQDLS